MLIQFLNVDLDIESLSDLQILVNELEKDCSPHIHFRNDAGNDFASFSHQMAHDKDINEIISLFCQTVENLSPKAREIWNNCCERKLDAGFESGNSPRNFKVEIRPEVVKRLSDLAASIVITIYATND